MLSQTLQVLNKILLSKKYFKGFQSPVIRAEFRCGISGGSTSKTWTRCDLLTQVGCPLPRKCLEKQF